MRTFEKFFLIGFMLGVVLAEAPLFRYCVKKERAANRREDARDDADHDADEQTVDGLHVCAQGGVVEGAPPPVGEARRDRDGGDADLIGGSGRLLLPELHRARSLVDLAEDASVVSVHANNSTRNGE